MVKYAQLNKLYIYINNPAKHLVI